MSPALATSADLLLRRAQSMLLKNNNNNNKEMSSNNNHLCLDQYWASLKERLNWIVLTKLTTTITINALSPSSNKPASIKKNSKSSVLLTSNWRNMNLCQRKMMTAIVKELLLSLTWMVVRKMQTKEIIKRADRKNS